VAKRRKGARPATGRQKVRDIFVPRPFEGLASECEWIALRELVPAASAPLRLNAEYAQRYPDRPITLATVLPMALPAISRTDGHVLVGLQRHARSGDASRDLAAALLAALETPPGETVPVPALPGEGPRLQDVLDNVPLEITVHDGFEFWLTDGSGDDPQVRASLEQANAAIYPTARLSAAPAAYWCRVPDRAHVRWVLPTDEDLAMDALARLGAAGALTLGEGTRLAGMFRAYGRIVPVWDLPREPEAAAWEAPLAEFAKRYAEAEASHEPLTAAERRSRQGLVSRQRTLR